MIRIFQARTFVVLFGVFTVLTASLQTSAQSACSQLFQFEYTSSDAPRPKAMGAKQVSALTEFLHRNLGISGSRAQVLAVQARRSRSKPIPVFDAETDGYDPYTIPKFLIYDGVVFREGWWRRNFSKQGTTKEKFDSETAFYWDEKANSYSERAVGSDFLKTLAKTPLYRGTNSNEAEFLQILKSINDGIEASPARLFAHLMRRSSLDHANSPIAQKLPTLIDMVRNPEKWPTVLSDASSRLELIDEVINVESGYYGVKDDSPPYFFSNSSKFAAQFALAIPNAKWRAVLVQFEVDTRIAPPDYLGFENAHAKEGSALAADNFFEAAYNRKRLRELIDSYQGFKYLD